jgi:Domain of unknown function (DUF4280)
VPKFLTTGATLSCTMGAAPSVFTATTLPGAPMVLGSLPAATIMEFVPMMNIMPFAMCMSPANPMVAAATAAALGVLTPMPCIPNVVAPWAPPSVCVTVNSLPAATAQSTCMCAWGGTISVTMPTQGPEDTQ